MEPSLKFYLDADRARLSELSGPSVNTKGFSSLFGPRFAHITLLRCAMVLHRRGFRRLAKVFSLLNFLLFGLEVPASLKIAPGLVIPHPQGTILGAREIGANATIFQQVTFGGKMADFEYLPDMRPMVEDNVTVCAGAKVLGSLTLGNGCTIGANAVVLEDVPPGRTAVGVPARLVG
jgi:serine O-acetyltransferase